MTKELISHIKQLTPEFNGALFDIPTGKYINGNHLLDGAALLPTHYGAAYLRQSPGSSMIAFTILNDKIRKTKPSTPERYGAAVRLLKLMGCGIKWKVETEAPEVVWFDLEGGMEDFGDTVRDMLHKDYTEELDDESKHASELAERMYQALNDGIGHQLSESVTAAVFGNGFYIDSISQTK